MDQLQVDIQDRLLLSFRVDDMVVPDLLEHCPRSGFGGHNGYR